jgi:hypothetical protein
VSSQYDLITVGGRSFPKKFLADALPDVKTALFFGKVYDLSAEDLALVLSETQDSAVIQAFVNEGGDHSITLQDFLVEEYYDADGNLTYDPDMFEGETGAKQQVQAELLPELWKQLETEIAHSIKDVAAKLSDTIAHMPGRTGEMMFKTMATMNAKRPVIGDYKAHIQHQQIKQVLVVFDVSGSMTPETVKTIVDDVVGLAYESNASLAIVSNTCTYWDAGAYNTDVVLEAAEYMGTHYEQLADLFSNRTWDAVVCVADYDSSPSAKQVLAQCQGKIGQLFDISLVPRSTYLAECLAYMADEVRPLLIGGRDLRYN